MLKPAFVNFRKLEVKCTSSKQLLEALKIEQEGSIRGN
jgi:hypothetical protein